MPQMPPYGEFIFGHEYAGDIVAIGRTVDEFQVGDRVVVEAHMGCRRCENCIRGLYTACLNYGNLARGHRANGFTTNGGLAEYAVNHVNTLYRIPDGVSYEEAEARKLEIPIIAVTDTTFVAEVMPDNSPMLRVFEDAGFDISRRLESGTTEVRLAIAPTPTYRAAVDERDHVAVTASLAPFFHPKTVAVVGASTRRGSIGGELFRNILESGFTGVAYPVNPKAAAIAGVKAYPSMTDIPDPVDLAVFCLPAESVLAEAEAALAGGTKALCVISAGFAETGIEGLVAMSSKRLFR